MNMQTWQTFSDPRFEFQLKYPEITPQGHSVEIDEIRVHFRSQDSQELYFEIARYPNLSAREGYNRLKGYIEQQFDELDVSELEATTLASQPAWQFSFKWPAGERVVMFIEKEQTLYRVIYDPRSPLNMQMVSTIEFFSAF